MRYFTHTQKCQPTSGAKDKTVSRCSTFHTFAHSHSTFYLHIAHFTHTHDTLGASFGFSILPKHTSTCALGEAGPEPLTVCCTSSAPSAPTAPPLDESPLSKIAIHLSNTCLDFSIWTCKSQSGGLTNKLHILFYYI